MHPMDLAQKKKPVKAPKKKNKKGKKPVKAPTKKTLKALQKAIDHKKKSIRKIMNKKGIKSLLSLKKSNGSLNGIKKLQSKISKARKQTGVLKKISKFGLIILNNEANSMTRLEKTREKDRKSDARWVMKNLELIREQRAKLGKDNGKMIGRVKGIVGGLKKKFQKANQAKQEKKIATKVSQQKKK